MASGSRDRSPALTVFGILVAIVAIAGTQFFGWEWETGGLVPTIVGVVVAGIAVAVVVRRVVE
ncbi:multidrug transporter [Halorubrum rubrum]|uniref:Multidrug transporter n=1 Tax=Halorubrum rubrum TaxID=1126240 RepID=A0ABD5R3J8_9EURY|nr:multidrug transporter [Halorubrum rubrum]